MLTMTEGSKKQVTYFVSFVYSPELLYLTLFLTTLNFQKLQKVNV